MLSYGYWQRRFGGDRGVIGRTIQVDAQTREIVGVMPRGFRMVDQDFDLLLPLAFDRDASEAGAASVTTALRGSSPEFRWRRPTPTSRG